MHWQRTRRNLQRPQRHAGIAAAWGRNRSDASGRHSPYGCAAAWAHAIGPACFRRRNHFQPNELRWFFNIIRSVAEDHIRLVLPRLEHGRLELASGNGAGVEVGADVIAAFFGGAPNFKVNDEGLIRVAVPAQKEAGRRGSDSGPGRELKEKRRTARTEMAGSSAFPPG